MSWNARRYRKELYAPPLSRHHIPPQHPDRVQYVIKRINNKHHRAYHTLFGASPTFEDSVDILGRYWWPQQATEVLPYSAR